MTYGYLAALLFSLAGLTTFDARFKLAFFVQPVRSLVTLVVPFFFFVTWDLAGIAGGIFFRGQTDHLTGITIFHEFPIEELFFLAVLCYTTLLTYSAFSRRAK